MNRAPESLPEEPANLVGSDDDPTVFESRAKGENLHAKLSPQDLFLEDLKSAYATDPLYIKVMEHPDHHSAFEMKDACCGPRIEGERTLFAFPLANMGRNPSME